MRKKGFPPIEEVFAYLLQNLSAMGKVPSTVIEFLKSECEMGRFLPKEYVLKKGEVCEYCYFIVSGLLRAFALKDDNDVTVWVMTGGDVAIGVSSFYRQKPSEEYIVALEETVYVRLHYKKLEWLYENHVEFNVIGRKLTEKYHELFNKRLCTMADSKEERYRKFLDEYPHLVNRVDSKHIATLLGMTPSYLSKIKRNL